MKENKNGWLDLFRRGVLFINRDLLWMVVWQAGAWLLACLVMAVFSFFVKEDVLGILDVPGICALTVGTLFFFFEAINFFGGQYSLLVGFGLSRRRTVALGWFLCILMGVVELAVVGVLNTLWRLVLATPGQFAEILALVPLWGWAVLLLLPLSLAVRHCIFSSSASAFLPTPCATMAVTGQQNRCLRSCPGFFLSLGWSALCWAPFCCCEHRCATAESLLTTGQNCTKLTISNAMRRRATGKALFKRAGKGGSLAKCTEGCRLQAGRANTPMGV